MKTSMEDIVERWNTRIVSNGWNNSDGSGVDLYLAKYGKNISDEKLEKFAEYAKSIGETKIANAFLNKTSYGIFKQYGEVLPDSLNPNFEKFYYHDETNINFEEEYSLFKESTPKYCYYVKKKASFDNLRERMISFGKKHKDIKFCLIGYEDGTNILVFDRHVEECLWFYYGLDLELVPLLIK